MISRMPVVYFVFLALLTDTVSASIAEGGQRSVKSVEVMKQAPQRRLAALPAGAPIPVMYFLPGATAPSCGVVSSHTKNGNITPIFETEPNQAFPYCMEVSDVAMFKLNGSKNYVFRYRQRDTREDSSTGYFFVQLSPTGLCPLDWLNSETVPQDKPIQSVASWAKGRLLSLKKYGVKRGGDAGNSR